MEMTSRGRIAVLLVLTVANVGMASVAAAAPSNDDMADAATIILGSHHDIDLTDATEEPGEPSPSCAHVRQNVWFTTVAPRALLLSLDLAGTEGPFSGGLYRGETPTGIGGCIDPVSHGSFLEMESRRNYSVAVAEGERIWLQLGVEEYGPARLRVTFDEAATLQGTISNLEGDPLEGMCATAVDPQRRALRLVSANEAGFYRIGGLPPETYRLVAGCSPDLTRWAASAPSFDEAQAFAVGAGETVQGVDVAMHIPPRVVGSITGDGEPVEGACVDLIAATEEDGIRASIDDEGRYLVHAPGPGAYHLLVSDCTGDRFAPFWHPNAEHRLHAVTIDLAAEETRRVDITIDLSALGSIQGRVVSGRGDGLVDMCVTLVDEAGNEARSTLTWSEGFYRFDDVTPDDYRLKAHDCAGTSFAPSWLGGATESEAVWFHVWGDRAASLQDVVMEPDPEARIGSIAGTIQDAQGRPLQGIRIDVLDGTSVVGSAVTGSMGNYKSTALPDGWYRVRASGSSDDGRIFFPATSGEVELYAGTPVTGIDLSLVEQVADSSVLSVDVGTRAVSGVVPVTTRIHNLGTLRSAGGELTVEVCPRTAGRCEVYRTAVPPMKPDELIDIATAWDSTGFIGEVIVTAALRVPFDRDARNDSARTTSVHLIDGAGLRAG